MSCLEASRIKFEKENRPDRHDFMGKSGLFLFSSFYFILKKGNRESVQGVYYKQPANKFQNILLFNSTVYYIIRCRENDYKENGLWQ